MRTQDTREGEQYRSEEAWWQATALLRQPQNKTKPVSSEKKKAKTTMYALPIQHIHTPGGQLVDGLGALTPHEFGLLLPSFALVEGKVVARARARGGVV